MWSSRVSFYSGLWGLNQQGREGETEAVRSLRSNSLQSLQKRSRSTDSRGERYSLRLGGASALQVGTVLSIDPPGGAFEHSGERVPGEDLARVRQHRPRPLFQCGVDRLLVRTPNDTTPYP